MSHEARATARVAPTLHRTTHTKQLRKRTPGQGRGDPRGRPGPVSCGRPGPVSCGRPGPVSCGRPGPVSCGRPGLVLTTPKIGFSVIHAGDEEPRARGFRAAVNAAISSIDRWHASTMPCAAFT